MKGSNIRGGRTAALALASACAAALASVLPAPALRAGDVLPTGKVITPPNVKQEPVGSLPMNLVLSPDGRYVVSTDMGFKQSLNAINVLSGVRASSVPYQNNQSGAVDPKGLYFGLAFLPDGTLFAAQGNNDTIAVLSLNAGGQLTQTRSISTRAGDFPAGVAVDAKGHLYVANNDPSTYQRPGSVAIYDYLLGAEIGRVAFHNSFGGTPNFPLAIAALGDGSKTYVSSQRDACVYVLNTAAPGQASIKSQIPTGQHPIYLLLDKAQRHLYVANAHSDTVSVIDTTTDKVVSTLLLRPERLKSIPGATPTGLALSPDEKTLYITLGDMNAVAVASVAGSSLTLQGYFPAGWYPSAIAIAPNGNVLLTNAKGNVAKHPNPGYKQYAFNDDPQYDLNLIGGTVQTTAAPTAQALAKQTLAVLNNNGVSTGPSSYGKSDQNLFDTRLDAVGLKAGKIKHVFYIVKENRTYDQVLGDVKTGNGDPAIALFGQSVTPNQHAIAERFVLLDNFYDCGEASGDGWPWSTQGMANEYVIKNLPYNYSNRGRNYDFEGQDNGYPAGGFPAKDIDGKVLSEAFPNGAPAIPDVAVAPSGHIWDIVRQAGLSYRNYGFFSTFGVGVPGHSIIPDNYPASAGLRPEGHDLAGITDYDFRRYDAAYADSDAATAYGDAYPLKTYGKHNAPSRFQEWNHEFQEMLAKDPSGNSVPAFQTVRFLHDHTQGMSPGKHSPRAQVADNDYAVGQFVEALSKSPIWESSAVFIIEDDSQDGPDHVDSHRSICFVASPYIKQATVDHTFYNTDSVLKTIEMLLGLKPMSQYDAVANPLLVFGTKPTNNAKYAAVLPAKSIVTEYVPQLTAMKPTDQMFELAVLSSKMDFDHPDSAPARKLNEIVWKSVHGADANMPAPKHVLASVLDKKKDAKDKDDDD